MQRQQVGWTESEGDKATDTGASLKSIFTTGRNGGDCAFSSHRHQVTQYWRVCPASCFHQTPRVPALCPALWPGLQSQDTVTEGPREPSRLQGPLPTRDHRVHGPSRSSRVPEARICGHIQQAQAMECRSPGVSTGRCTQVTAGPEPQTHPRKPLALCSLTRVPPAVPDTAWRVGVVPVNTTKPFST